MQRILLIGDYPPPHGGVAIHVKQLHAHLRARGVEVRVLDIGKGGRPAPDVLPVRTGRRLLEQLARHARDGFTIHLHTSGNNAKAWALIGLVGAVPGVPKIVTLHSGLLPKFLEASVARRISARLALLGFTSVVSVSRAIDETVAQLGVPAQRRQVLPAFIASQVTPGSPPATLKAVRARRRPLLAMAHHPSPVYGRAAMFEALQAIAAHHPECGLALFGPGLDAPEFQEDARRFGVEPLLECFGELDHAAALAVIASADVFVRPTTADGDSISVREALALGVPCVATNVATRPEGTLTCVAGNAASLSETIIAGLASRGPFNPGPDSGSALELLYRHVREGVHAEDRRGRMGRTGVAGSRSGGVLQRLGWRPAEQDAHHADSGA